jgi:hypothetical protein
MRTHRYNLSRKSSDTDSDNSTNATPISPPPKKKMRTSPVLPALVEKGSDADYARNIKAMKAEVNKGKNRSDDMIKRLLEVSSYDWFCGCMNKNKNVGGGGIE